jgi:putative toxin-antitoxin system toxin component, PIN family
MNTPCIVLDTNVCLDLFVFYDRRCRELAQMLKMESIRAVTRNDCRDEWLRVLMYPSLSLDESTRKKCIAAYDEVISCCDFEKKDYTFLPVCQDMDDQKFLELAFDSNAHFLLTKDKALLKLSAKIRKSSFFRIMKPEYSNLILATENPD